MATTSVDVPFARKDFADALDLTTTPIRHLEQNERKFEIYSVIFDLLYFRNICPRPMSHHSYTYTGEDLFAGARHMTFHTSPSVSDDTRP